MATRLKIGQPRSHGSHPCMNNKAFLPSTYRADRLWGSPSLIYAGYKRDATQTRESYHSKFNDEVKNAEAIPTIIFTFS
jgi:hypothetical protein